MSSSPTQPVGDTPITNTDILLIASTIITMLISLVDVLLNSYVAAKDKKIKLVCSDCCTLDYSDSGEELPKTTS